MYKFFNTIIRNINFNLYHKILFCLNPTFHCKQIIAIKNQLYFSIIMCFGIMLFSIPYYNVILILINTYYLEIFYIIL